MVHKAAARPSRRPRNRPAVRSRDQSPEQGAGQKQPRPRGRPRAYDPDQALAGAMQAFWRLGYSGTSLDQLSDATDMNRPSMYAAFGDKHALYLKTLDLYTNAASAQIRRVLDPEVPLAEGLARFYESALKTYLPAGESARGCYLIGTATTEAADDPEVREKLLGALRSFDRALETRLRQAQTRGEIDPSADVAALTLVASAVLHTLAIRSRTGDSRAALQMTIDTAIRLICGGSNKQRAAGTRK